VTFWLIGSIIEDLIWLAAISISAWAIWLASQLRDAHAPVSAARSFSLSRAVSSRIKLGTKLRASAAMGRTLPVLTRTVVSRAL
jgi:hypothetical protein